MPWREIESTWNIRSVNDNDFAQEVSSMHEKWWDYPVSGSEKLHDYFMSVRWQMEGIIQHLTTVRVIPQACSNNTLNQASCLVIIGSIYQLSYSLETIFPEKRSFGRL